MPKFFFTVRDAHGKKMIDYTDANNEDELITRLQAKGLTVVNIQPAYQQGGGLQEATAAKVRIRRKHLRITEEDLVLLCRQFATLLGAGVTVLKCLDIICKQVTSIRLQKVLIDVQKGMEAGLSLHEALAKHPTVFSDLWCNLVESGEASGNLAVILGRLAGYLERNAEFKRKVITALIYPAILFFACVGALLFLTISIVPTFKELFEGFDLELPVLTKMIMAFSEMLRKYFVYIFVGLIALGYFLRSYIKTKEGKKKFEELRFSLPTFGDFFRALVVERFSSEMSTLIESGVPILYSLDITEHSVDNLTMAEIIRKIKEEVRNGKSLSAPLDQSGFFEPMVVQMVGIGEEIGELPQMFKKINEFYQEYVETFLVRFTSMFEPFMLIFMGGVIGLLVVGIFLPLFQIARIGG
jgi:type IV pilus assembly protein PilC